MSPNTRKNPIIERIIQLRVQHFGERGKSDFARELGISPSTYSYYEQDRVPSADILLKMSRITGVGLDWLITGENIFANAKNNSSGAGVKRDIGRVVEALVAENPKLERTISTFIEIICEKNDIKNPLIGSNNFRERTQGVVDRDIKSSNTGDGGQGLVEHDIKSSNAGDGGQGLVEHDIKSSNTGDDGRGLVEHSNKSSNAGQQTQDGLRSVGGEAEKSRSGDKNWFDELKGGARSVVSSGSERKIAADGKLAGKSRSVVGGGSERKIAADGKLTGKSQSLRDADVRDRDKDGGGSGDSSGLGDGVSKLVKERMIPVLGRTAAGIIHCWDQCGMPDSWQAETKLAELVKKHIGKDIVCSNNGEVEIDSDAAKLAGRLAGRFDTNACIVQVSADDEGIVEFVDSCDMAKRYPDCFGLRVDGDSMMPRICDGDIVILSPSVLAKQGSIAVAKVRDQIGVTCKIIRFDKEQVHLVAGNENYETRVVERNQLIWALAVLGHVKQR